MNLGLSYLAWLRCGARWWEIRAYGRIVAPVAPPAGVLSTPLEPRESPTAPSHCVRCFCKRSRQAKSIGCRCHLHSLAPGCFPRSPPNSHYLGGPFQLRRNWRPSVAVCCLGCASGLYTHSTNTTLNTYTNATHHATGTRCTDLFFQAAASGRLASTSPNGWPSAKMLPLVVSPSLLVSALPAA